MTYRTVRTMSAEIGEHEQITVRLDLNRFSVKADMHDRGNPEVNDGLRYAVARHLLLSDIRRLRKQYTCIECHQTSNHIECEVRGPGEAGHEAVWSFTQSHRQRHPKGKGLHRKLTISEWLDIVMEKDTSKMCGSCGGSQVKVMSYGEHAPNFLYLIAYGINLQVETEIKLPDESERYRLCGVIYFGQGHFVSRIVDKSGEIWYHDGARTGENVKYEKNILNISNHGWQKARSFDVSAYLYTKL